MSLDIITNVGNKGHSLYLALFDFVYAFDNISLKLIQMLEAYGINSI